MSARNGDPDADPGPRGRLAADLDVQSFEYGLEVQRALRAAAIEARTRRLREHGPPDGWDGVFRLETK